MLVNQLEAGRSVVENQYTRTVDRFGNIEAQKIVNSVFEPSSRNWRGIGPIPKSGLQLRPAFAQFDALKHFQNPLNLKNATNSDSSECQSGRILRGLMKPSDCPAFGTRCTPDQPLGAPMVSSEGACSAYYRYRPSSVAKV